jgi:hypothetical protein
MFMRSLIKSKQDGAQCLGICHCTNWLQFGSSQHVLRRSPHVAQKARRRSDVIVMDISLLEETTQFTPSSTQPFRFP